VWPFCRPKPLASITVMPWSPISCSASFTSSSLKGFMIASIFFIVSPSQRACWTWHSNASLASAVPIPHCLCKALEFLGVQRCLRNYWASSADQCCLVCDQDAQKTISHAEFSQSEPGGSRLLANVPRRPARHIGRRFWLELDGARRRRRGQGR